MISQGNRTGISDAAKQKKRKKLHNENINMIITILNYIYSQVSKCILCILCNILKY